MPPLAPAFPFSLAAEFRAHANDHLASLGQPSETGRTGTVGAFQACFAAEGFKLLALNALQVMCGQRLPTMSGNVFLERVNRLYADTMRVVLSG